MVSKHPNIDLLSEYATGGLTPAQNATISAHLHYCARCRDHVRSLEEIGGWMVEHSEKEPVSDNLLDAVLARIDASAACPTETEPVAPDLAMLPRSVQKLVPGGRADWRPLISSLEVAQIPCGETRFELSLHRIKAGGRSFQHDHKGLEITVVLRGSFSDGDGVYQEGDFIVREPGDVHMPIATQNEECVCLSACEAPIRLTGMLTRVLNPFLGFNPA